MRIRPVERGVYQFQGRGHESLFRVVYSILLLRRAQGRPLVQIVTKQEREQQQLVNKKVMTEEERLI